MTMISDDDTDVPLETQKTVFDWCEIHYPNDDTAQKIVNLIEEVTELGRVLGVAPDVMRRAMDIAIRKSNDPVGDRDCIVKEVGDTQLSIFNLAETLGVDAIAALDVVMLENRARSMETSAARSALKLGMGLTGKSCPE